MTRRPAGNIFIYCDSAKHTKRAAVTNYFPDPSSGVWREIPASPATDHEESSLQVLDGDEPFQDLPRGRDRRRRGSPSPVRYRVRLGCRRCPANVPIRTAEELDFVLTKVAGAGRQEVSLSEMSAMLDPSRRIRGRAQG